MPSIEHAISMQAECAAYTGPDAAGAWAGLCDWLMEECLMEQEKRMKSECDHEIEKLERLLDLMVRGEKNKTALLDKHIALFKSAIESVHKDLNGKGKHFGARRQGWEEGIADVCTKILEQLDRIRNEAGE